MRYDILHDVLTFLMLVAVLVMLVVVAGCNPPTDTDPALTVSDPPAVWQDCREVVVPVITDDGLSGRHGLQCTIEWFFAGATREDWEAYKEANGL